MLLARVARLARRERRRHGAPPAGRAEELRRCLRRPDLGAGGQSAVLVRRRLDPGAPGLRAELHHHRRQDRRRARPAPGRLRPGRQRAAAVPRARRRQRCRLAPAGADRDHAHGAQRSRPGGRHDGHAHPALQVGAGDRLGRDRHAGGAQALADGAAVLQAVGRRAPVGARLRMARARRAAGRRLALGALGHRPDARRAARPAGLALLAWPRAEAGRRCRRCEPRLRAGGGPLRLLRPTVCRGTGPEDRDPAAHHRQRGRGRRDEPGARLRAGAPVLRAEPAPGRQSRMELAAARHDRSPTAGRGRIRQAHRHARPHRQHGRSHHRDARLHAALSLAVSADRGALRGHQRARYRVGLWPDPTGIALHHQRAFLGGRRRPDAADAGHRATGGQEARHGRSLARADARHRHQYPARHLVPVRHLPEVRRFGGAGHGRLQRRAGTPAPVAAGADPAGRGRDLRRDHPLQRDARLREERAVEHHLLRGAVRGQAAVAEGAARLRLALSREPGPARAACRVEPGLTFRAGRGGIAARDSFPARARAVEAGQAAARSSRRAVDS
ncbi:hypothetical protein BGLA2_20009 [Burkholderia gladioli]|nr:hypothetical protein BGLA2_20009 [Burkholderia gladioli]